MAIPLEHYRVFYSVAKSHNMTAAARELFLSQPSVSRYIQQLERELSCTLFVRSKSGVLLTPEAEKLYRHLEAAFDHIDKAEEELQSDRQLQTGVVRIGASEMTLHHYLLPYLRRFRQAFPQIRLRIANTTTPRAVEALKENLIDFAIVISPVDQDAQLERRALMRFRDIVVAGPAFSELRGTEARVETLSRYPLICLEKHTTSRRFWELIFSENGARLQPGIELAATDLIVPLVRSDLGIGFVPAEFARPSLAADEIFEVKLAQAVPPREICFLKDRRRPLSAAGEAFCRILEDPAEESSCTAAEGML